MKVGVVGYSNNSGLGNYISNFRKHLPFDSQMVIRHPDKGTRQLNIPCTYSSITPKERDLEEYLDIHSPDVVMIIETAFNDEFFSILKSRGVGVVYVPMIDCTSVAMITPFIDDIDLIINHTKYGHNLYKHFGDKAQYLPYPVDTEYFCPCDDSVEFDFLHNQGTCGSGYRKATDQVFIAFRQLYYQNTKVKLLVNSQPYEYIHSQLSKDAPNVTIKIKDVPNAIDIYKGANVYVAPSRREGLGLPLLEAMSCGLPVITTNAPPMNEWFDSDILLVSIQAKQGLPYGDIPMYTPNPFELLQKMVYAVEHPKHMQRIGKINRKIIEEKFSWRVLKDKYLKLFESVVKESKYSEYK